VDFGLAKANSQLEKSEPGIIKGKFSYLSPEAALGQDVDHRTDIFAVGIILWELLAGQRLFLGETDFQTVKRVQQANVPLVSSVNKKVPPELDRIVKKALAREIGARYQTARELGQDLANLLFKLGQSVSTFDIAQLVQVAMHDRARRSRPPQGSIIDKLIEEALLEFTSLTDDKDGGKPKPGQAAAPSAGALPLNPAQFVDPTNWAKEIGIAEVDPNNDPVRLSLPAEAFQAGNLSALEDEPPSSRSPSGTGPAAAPVSPRSAPISSARGGARPPAPSSSGAMRQAGAQVPVNPRTVQPSSPAIYSSPIVTEKRTNRTQVVVVVLAAAAVFAAAWMTGLIGGHH